MISSYLRAPDPRLFVIDEDESAWLWEQDRSTAMIDKQLALILQHLTEHLQGVPSIVPIMCIASAQRSWEGQACWQERLRVLPAKGKSDPRLESVIEFLHFVSELPSSLRCGVESTVAILYCGLTDKRHWFLEADIAEAEKISQYLLLDADERPLNASAHEGRRRENTRCRRAWETLVELSKSVTDQNQLSNWIRTGLSDLPFESETVDIPELEPAAEPSIREVLEELRNDPQCESLAKLSQSLGSMISLPRKPTAPDGMPIGGVSDISNRGSPERLLSSELAADPMVMLARIANGQALYSRREVPPSPQPKHRDVLIESSIRCWGVRRVYLAAVALGIGLAEESRDAGQTEFHVVNGGYYESCDFTSRESVISFLERLDISRDPTNGFEQYFEDHVPIDGNEESIPLLIVTTSTKNDPRFTALLLRLPLPILVLDVEVDGKARLSHCSKHGVETLQELNLELPSSNQPRGKVLALEGETLPAFSAFAEPPLLFHPPNNNRGFFCLESDSPNTWLVTSDRRLLSFVGAEKGGEQYGDSLPGNQVLCIQASSNSASGVVASTSGEHFWFTTDEQGKKLHCHRLDIPLANARYCVSNQFLLAFAEGVEAVISKDDGTIIEQQRTSRRHMGRNYVLDSQRFLWMHGGGAPSDWHKITRLDDMDEYTGCVVNTLSGTAYAVSSRMTQLFSGDQPVDPNIRKSLRMDGGSRPRSFPKFDVRSSSRDMTSWLLRTDDSATGKDALWYLLRLTRGTVTQLSDTHLSTLIGQLDPHAAACLKPRSIRTRVTAIARSSRGLVFRVPGRRYALLRPAHGPQRGLVLDPVRGGDEEDHEFEKPFKVPSFEGDRGWTLRKAALPGGTCWLDSRGLVHLKRDDDSRELTLVLSAPGVSGWFSETGCFGSTYFHPFGNETGTQHLGNVPVHDAVIQWLEGWR
ncbi:MAG: hypothetical protein AAGI63_11155 [Planctomycetota bacterium]